MGRQQLLLKQELTIPQILRTYGKQFRQITERYSDGRNGRCALGVIWSYLSFFHSYLIFQPALKQLGAPHFDVSVLLIGGT